MDFLHDIWEQEPVTVEPTDEANLREFYQKYGEKLFNAFEWDGKDSKMFQWLKSFQEGRKGLSFRCADLACSLQICSPAQLEALGNYVVERPAVACIATEFEFDARRVCHVVNVWYDGQRFCLRDSARAGTHLDDGTAPTLIQAVELSGIRERRNGQILHGMAATPR